MFQGLSRRGDFKIKIPGLARVWVCTNSGLRNQHKSAGALNDIGITIISGYRTP